MAKVFGQITLNVITSVDGKSEELGLLQANYKLNPDTMISWKLQGVDCNGKVHEINVCDCVNVNLNEFLG